MSCDICVTSGRIGADLEGGFRLCFQGWARRGSNPGPSDYESPALTTELRARPEPTELAGLGRRRAALGRAGPAPERAGLGRLGWAG